MSYYSAKDGYFEVKFSEYCPTCKFADLSSVKDPCNYCLEEPANYGTHEPVCYEEEDD